MALKKSEMWPCDPLDLLVIKKLRRVYQIGDDVPIVKLAVYDSYTHYWDGSTVYRRFCTCRNCMNEKAHKCTSVRSFGPKSRKEEVWSKDGCTDIDALRTRYLKTEVKVKDSRDCKERKKDGKDRKQEIDSARRRKYNY